MWSYLTLATLAACLILALKAGDLLRDRGDGGAFRAFRWALATVAIVAALPWVAAFLDAAGAPAGVHRAAPFFAGLAAGFAGTSLAARQLPFGWAIVVAALLLATLPWIAAYAAIAMYESGWQGLQREDFGSEDMGDGAVLLGVVLWTPTAILAGFFVGVLSQSGKRRRTFGT
jgi:hypothetical protein